MFDMVAAIADELDPSDVIDVSLDESVIVPGNDVERAVMDFVSVVIIVVVSDAVR